MATLKIRGLEEYERMLSKLGSFDTIRAVCGKTIYSGAEIVADAMRAGIESLPEVDDYIAGTPGAMVSGVTPSQKQGLLDGFGISPMGHRDGYYDVKLGFDGYNDTKTKSYPLGQPNSLIARSVNSGTSFRKKIPFVDDAVKQSRKQAEAAMVKTADEEFEKIAKGK